MRWEALFRDLQAQLEASRRDELDAEVAERVRIERTTVGLLDRLRAHVGLPLAVTTVPTLLRGPLVEVGADFLLLDDEGGGQSLVPLAAVQHVTGLGRAVAPAPGAVLRALGLRSALRGLARDRCEVRVLTVSGEVRGVVSLVAADHVDLVDLSPLPDGPAAVGGHGGAGHVARVARTVPLAAVQVVRSR